MPSLNRDVAVRKTMQQYVDARNNIVGLLRDGISLFEQAESVARENMHYGIPGFRSPSLDELTESLDGRFWSETLERTGVTRLMDAEARAAFQRDLERKKVPAFSMDAIETQFLTLAQDADKMFRRGVANVFKRLDPKYWTNTNQPYEISRRNILTYMFDNWAGHLSLHHSRRAIVNDIDRVLHVLDGKPFTPHSLETAVNDHFRHSSEPFENEYYQIKGFKNGNMHLLFKREDLVERVNREIAQYFNHDKLAEEAA